jgi:general secretion pathway protein K
MDQKGYALPVVMAISLIITVMTLSVTLSTRERIAVISELKDQSRARMKSYSAVNEVLFNVLTSNFTSTGIKIYLPEAKWKIWNLYGEPIALDDSVTVTLRDGAGMVSPVMQPEYLAALLSATSAGTASVNSFLDKLGDWQDADDLKRLNGAESWDYRTTGYAYTPRNFYIQSLDEIRLIKDFDPSLFDAFRGDLIYWGSEHVNYLTMSDKLLYALLKNEKMVSSLLQMRADQSLTGQYFTALTGIPRTEMVFPAPSGIIQIRVTARQNEAVDTIEMIVSKREMHTNPFTVLEWNR